MRLEKIIKISALLIFLMVQISGQTYKVVDTGQKKYYNNSSEISSPSNGQAFYGQDAQINGNLPSYQDNGDGTISDIVTGLMWNKSPDLNGDGKIDANDKLSQSEAMEYVKSFNLAGYTDWRVPTIKELYSLIMFYGEDPSGYQGTSTDKLVPFMNTEYFDFGYGDMNSGERVIDAQMVTSTIYVHTTMNGDETMFGVNFADGRIKGYPTGPTPGSTEDKQFFAYFVRGNTQYGINDFNDNNDGTISDKATQLMWMQDDSKTGMNWEEALAWAQTKNEENYLGYNDWRLPNVKELQSIVDYNRSPKTTGSAAIDPVFNCTKITVEDGSEDYPFYWSGTTHANMQGGSYASYVAFGRALGWMQGPGGGSYNLLDVHGAGAQRSDPKSGNASDYPYGHGPQGDVIRIDNFVRLVRDITDTVIDTTDNSGDKDTTQLGGVTLFAPLGNKTTYLMDDNDEIIKTWESNYAPGLSVYLLDDKSILRTGSVGKNNSVFGETGGAGGIVERYDWDGNKIWEFEYNSETYLSHHDIEYLPNGNILMIAWELKTEEEAIAAGRNPSLITGGQVWPDKIIEVKPNGSSGGEVVWEWKVWDHLIQDFDATKSNYGIVSDHPEKINLNFTYGNVAPDWNHINAVDYNAELDQILLTVHHFSEIWIIDHNTTTTEAAGSKGDLLYRWGNPQTYDRGTVNDQELFVPHDGRWIEVGYPGEGNVMIFNNGRGRGDGDYSSVDEIVLPLSGKTYSLSSNEAYGPDDLEWSYKSNPASDFFADHISGAHRLKDGNTLICNGPAGRFFEVDSEGAIVWEYVNPYTFKNPKGEEQNSVFRATRYYLDDLNDSSYTNIENDFSDIPNEFKLNQNYPNPFNPATKIDFSIPEDGKVVLEVFNILGQKVETLVNEDLGVGTYTVDFNAGNLSSGIYFYWIQSNRFVATRKMILIK